MKHIRKHKLGIDGRHKGYTASWKYRKDPKCSTCDVPLVKDKEDDNYNWRPARIARHTYKCSSCHNQERSRYYYLNKYKNLKNKVEILNLEHLARFNQIKEGFVYVLTNPAWKDWIKVGMAVDAEDRCSAYQTGSPHRDYTVHYKRFFKDRRSAEQKAHDLLSGISTESNGEWFKINKNDAKGIIKTI